MKIKPIVPFRTDSASVKKYVKAVEAGRNSVPTEILSSSLASVKVIKNFDNQKKLITRATNKSQILNIGNKNKK